MAEYTYEDIKGMTVAQLREVAADIDDEAVRGYTQLHKDELIHAICTALNLQEVVHHEVVGVDKASIKRRIRALKKERDAALQAHDSTELKKVRRQIHRLKRRIHKATV